MEFLSEYLIKRFGQKVYKLARDGGMSCPNRDGRLGYRGCIFCSERGSGDFASPKAESVSLQIDRAIEMLGKKGQNCGYIAYFQNFTNTYAPVAYLEKIFTQAIEDDRILVLSVATRPDCLPSPVLSLIGRLAKNKPVWVELGLQTVDEKTAEYIRRGYPLEVYDAAVKALHSVGAKVITHQILYLPGESVETMVNTTKHIGEVGSDGIKLQLLHILKDADIYEDYRSGKVYLPTLEEYAETVKKCCAVLPERTVIHRLTGDGAKARLVAPLWTADKKRVYDTVKKAVLSLKEGRYDND